VCIFGQGICRVLLRFSLVDFFAHGLGKVYLNLGLAYRLSVGVGNCECDYSKVLLKFKKYF